MAGEDRGLQSMSEADDTQRRWLAIAEQLGLPPEPASEPEPAPAPIPATDIPSRATASEEDATELSPLDLPAPALPAEQPETVAKGPPPAVPAEEDMHSRGRPRRAGLSDQEAGVESAQPGAETPVIAQEHREEERSPSGRRRRRSPKAADSSSRGEGTAAEGSPDDESEAESRPQRGPRRGRGRGRHKKAAPEEITADGVEPDAGPVHTLAAEAESDTDEEDMSGWSIPSWQELIESLYRPDR